MKKTFLILVIMLIFTTSFGAGDIRQGTFATIDECLVKIGMINHDRPMEIVTNKPCEITGYFKGEGGNSWSCKCNNNGTVTGWYSPK